MVMPQEMDQDQEKNKYHIIIIFVNQRKEDDENAFNKETSGGAHQPSKAEKTIFQRVPGMLTFKNKVFVLI